MQEVMQHEVAHLMGMSGWPVDKYYSNSQPLPGWEGNIMAVAGGMVEERNVSDVITYGRPYLAPSKGGSQSENSSSNTSPQGCMAPGGNCWN